MLVSVVIPVYERTLTLHDALRSVSIQTLKPIEVIVVDDGSASDILCGFSNNLQNFKLIKLDNNLGVSSARNRGIKEAKGDYIAFLDSDDIWVEDKLEHQLNFMVSGNFSVSHTNEHWLRGETYLKEVDKFKRYGGKIFSSILDKCRISPSTLVIKRDIFSDVGFFDESLRVCEDYEFFLRLALKYEIGYFLEKLTVKRAITNDQLSNIKHIESIRLDILEKFSEDMGEEDLLAFQNELMRKRSIVKKLF